MNSNLKIGLVALAILVTGFVAGFMTNRTMMKKRMAEVVAMRHAEGVTNHFFYSVHVPERKRPEFEPMVHRHAVTLEALNWEFTRRRNPIFDSLQREMLDYLEAQQQEELEQWVRLMKKMSPMEE